MTDKNIQTKPQPPKADEKVKRKRKVIWSTPALDDSGKKKKGFKVEKVTYLTNNKK